MHSNAGANAIEAVDPKILETRKRVVELYGECSKALDVFMGRQGRMMGEMPPEVSEGGPPKKRKGKWGGEDPTKDIGYLATRQGIEHLPAHDHLAGTGALHHHNQLHQ